MLTTAEYRALHPTALEDEALQLLLDAAWADVVAFTGPDGDAVEWFGGGPLIALRVPAASITSIVEHVDRDGTSTTLAADDYLVDPTGLLLYRLSTGTNPARHWCTRTVVTYAIADREAQMHVAQADLVQLAENYAAGSGSETIGSWTEAFKQATAANEGEHDAVLSRLTIRGRMLVV